VASRSDRPPVDPTPRARPAAAGLAALALAAALSPVLVELARHLAAEPAARYVLLFPPLFARAAARDLRGGSASRGRGGWLLLGAGLALELLAFGGGMPKLARPALPLAVIGLCRALGLCAPRTALLAIFFVPVPYAACSFASPALERLWFGAAVALLRPAGAEVAIEASRDFLFDVAGAGGSLAVRSWDGGLPLAVLAAGLAWYGSLPAGSLRRTGLAALAGLGLQAPIALAAVALLAAGHAGAGAAVRDHAFWAVALVGLVCAERAVGPARAPAARWESA
jgi:hypothetical protein